MYEINISRFGTHFFATAERSIQDEAKLRLVLIALFRAFPEKDGYRFEATFKRTTGDILDIPAIISIKKSK